MDQELDLLTWIQNGDIKHIDHILEAHMNDLDSATLSEWLEHLYGVGFYPQAKLVASELLKRGENTDEMKIYLAEIALEDGNDLEALDYLHQISKDSEYYLSALLTESDYYLAQGLPEVSLKKLSEAKALAPEEMLIDFAIAEVHFATGQYQQASLIFESLIEKDHHEIAEIDLKSRLSQCYQALGYFEEAKNIIQNNFAANEDADHLFQLALLSFQADAYDEAIRHLESLLNIDPYYLSAYPLIVMSYYHQGQIEHALDWVEKALRYSDQDTDLFVLAGRLYEDFGERKKALKHYKKALEIDPLSEEAFISYLESLQFQDAYDDIVEHIESSPVELKTIPRVQWLYAISLNEIEAFEQAKSAFEEAAIYLTDSAPFLKDYLSFLVEEGAHDQAMKYAKKILAAEPDNQEIFELYQRLSEDIIH